MSGIGFREQFPDWVDHSQMSPEEVGNEDDALAYMLQTHLCYSYIQAGDLPFRVLKERLQSIGYEVVKREGRISE